MAEITVGFDAESHPADAIQRAAYRFADRFSCELVRTNDRFDARLFFPEQVDAEVVGAFRIEVVDQVLRERIRAETEDVRNLILALAFSKTGLTDEAGE
jgi:His-Xaa-Ser system protein HxsD